MQSETVIQDLAVESMTASLAANTGHFIPHSHAVIAAAKAIQTSNMERAVQLLMGETDNKVKKYDYKTLCASEIKDGHVLIGMCGNVTAYCRTLVDFDVESVEASNVPFLHRAFRTVALVISSKEAKAYCRKHACNANLWYFAFNLLNRIDVLYTKALHDEESIVAANPRNGDSKLDQIDKSPFKRAAATLTKGLEDIASFLSDASVVEEPPVFQNLRFSAKSKAALVSPTKPKGGGGGGVGNDGNKRKGSPNGDSGGDSKKDKKDNKGAINCADGKLIKLPDKFPDGETPLCPAKLRNNSRGCRNPKCKKSHKGPNKWSTTLIQFMKKVVEDSPDLTWNPEVMTPSILSLNMNQGGDN